MTLDGLWPDRNPIIVKNRSHSRQPNYVANGHELSSWRPDNPCR